MRKRILSFLIMLCMVTALLPANITVFASTVANGTCGDNLTWNLDSSGTLTISGTGKMTDWTEDNTPPWYSLMVKTVVIEENVTSIGNYAFSRCSGITSVTINEGVTSIGKCAFDYCTQLESLTIPTTVTKIYNEAFVYCNAIKNIYISDLKAYLNISASSMPCATNLYVNNSLLRVVEIPDGVTNIPLWAFKNNTNITNVKISSSVTSIGVRAFDGCSNLNDITIPSSVTTIGNNAFSSCDSLTDITIPDSVTSLGENAFWCCKNLKNISIGSGVKTIEQYTFWLCNKLENVNIGSGVTSIAWRAFARCESINNVMYNGTEDMWNNIIFDSENYYLTEATRTYFAYITIYDKDGNKLVDTTQNIGEYVDTSKYNSTERADCETIQG